MLTKEARLTESLTSRQEDLLRLIVHDYVAVGRAIGSKSLVANHRLAFSSATIRNEMMELERRGFIEQPHTSAGRVPTDQGYRYYVERLMDEPRLPLSEQLMILHQFRQVETRLQGWMQLASAVLAQATGNVSVVTAPRAQGARLKHFELVAIHDRLILLVVVTHDSAVKQVVVESPEPVEQAGLRTLGDLLEARFAGKNADDLAAAATRESGLAWLVTRQLAELLREEATPSAVELEHAGLELALQQPEFAGGHAAGQIVELLEGGAFLGALLPQIQPADGVQVFIGEENGADELRSYGIVVATYGVRHEVIGLVGVLGPRRMQYQRSIGSVRYMAGLLTTMMGRLHGATGDSTSAHD